VDPVTALIVNKNLDGLALRAVATAGNIANANSPGFVTSRVTFEDALRHAAALGPGAVRQVQPQLVREASAQGSPPRLDQELATAAETSMRYSALINLLGRQMQISHIAMRGGQ
jgi:flagellar basal-body rod protein FlgB